jgi:dihydroorotase/N-acyl-D-amino-acid deacylase
MPGIIDIHNHAIRPNAARSGIYLWPDAENLIRQGVTTVIGGPDGSSPLPIENDFQKLEASPATVNYGSFVGHGTIRATVVGREDRIATDDELEEMRAEVRKAMDSGAFGLSSGLLYAPGSFAPAEEVIELAKVVKPYGGIYISHMRNEALGLLDSIRETIRIGEEAGIPAQITHHKVMGAPMWGRSTESLALVDAAIERGVDVSSDQYPYPASSTGLPAVFPR